MMTDASHPVTQCAIEAFTQSYLQTIVASIQDRGNRWHIQLPSHIELDFLEEKEFDLLLEIDETETAEGEWALSPESRFAQQLLSEVTDQFSVGTISVTTEQVEGDYSYPDWILESDAQVESANFVPYYDRSALFVLVEIGVETVSEYQRDFVEGVTVDTNSLEVLPDLTTTVSDLMFDPLQDPIEPAPEDGNSEVSIEAIEQPLKNAQEVALEAVEDPLQQTREEATRAAEVELEEYRELQEQQLDDVQDDISSLTDRIQDLAKEIDEVTEQQERVELLQRRNELQSEKESLESERDQLLEEKQNGYREKRNKIFRRHSLEVSTVPVTTTIVTYERGELDIRLRHRNHSESIRVPYAVGEGVTGSVTCENCEEQLDGMNPIRLTTEAFGCDSCQ
jgi:DNA repair exonuclease SbcCD ATPase subunit